MFTRDLLVFDLETTGMDYYHHEIIELAALRLDKNTLNEKNSYVTFLKPEHIETASPEAQKVHGIDYNSLTEKPSLSEVLSILELKFPPEEVVLSAYNTVFDVPFLKIAYSKLGKIMPYDLHSMDIWGLAYLHWSRGNFPVNPKKKIGFGLSDMAEILQIETPGAFHSALTDVRVCAEVLRRLLIKLNA